MPLSGKDRILRTFRRQPVDRVAVCPVIYVNFVRRYWNDPEVEVAQATTALFDQLGCDIIHRNCFPWLYLFVETTGPTSAQWSVRISRREEAEGRITEAEITTPQGKMHAACQALPLTPYEDLVAYTRLPIQGATDLERLVRFEPRWQAADLDLSRIRAAQQSVGDRGVLCPWVQGVFNFVGVYYRNYQQLLMDPHIDEGFYRTLMEHALEQNWSYLQLLLEAGVEALVCSGNLAGGTAGPRFFEQFVLPYEQELVRRVHQAGGLVLWHNCGKAANLFNLYPQVGFDCFESLAGPPEGDSDWHDAKRRLGPHMALAGGIDQKEFLRTAAPGQVEQRVTDLLEVLKPGGGYFLSTVDYLAEDTPWDNLVALVAAGYKYGRYPAGP